MLSADGKPVHVGIDLPEFAVIRWTGMIGISVCGLKNADIVLALVWR